MGLLDPGFKCFFIVACMTCRVLFFTVLFKGIQLARPLVCLDRRGEPIAIYDGRPNGELLLATGRVEDDNASDCLTITVGLVQSDRLFTVKKQIVESVGFGIVQACA